ncbi:MAG: hypothetical protein RR900_00085 [Ruthenibacterium sp.]
MAEIKGTPIFRNLVADYLNIGTTLAPDICLMNVMEGIDENPNAIVVEKHYVSDASATVITAGYKQQFPITGDLYKENKVMEYIRDIGEEQKVGVETDYYRVRLYQPITGKVGTYYARKFRVGFEIASISGAGGEIMAIEGNMNTVGDVVVGTFDVGTRTFTAGTAPVKSTGV